MPTRSGRCGWITDAAGQVVERYDYLPFGEPGPNEVVSPNRQRFAGKEKDPENGFGYFGARYYANGTGRFTTVDPGHVNGNIEDPQSWNGYAYARNNPITFVDPDGREYLICSTKASLSCGSVSDQYFAILERTPSAGIRLWGGAIFAGNERVGYYVQTRVDVTLEQFIGHTGRLADRWLKEQSAEMAKGAAISAATAGLGIGVLARLEAIMAARAPTIVFKIGAANMAALSSAGVDMHMAKEGVRLLIASRLSTLPSIGTRIEGFVEVSGRILKVTAGVNSAGEMSVGAIRIIR